MSLVIAHYTCTECDSAGSDVEAAPGQASCWQCGAAVTITARVVTSAVQC